MRIHKKSFLFIALACLGCAPSLAEDVTRVRFYTNLQPVVPRTDKITVFNDAGRPAFRTTRDFLLKLVGTPTLVAVEWHVVRERVRVSGAGREGLWLSCNDLEPGALICSTRPRLVGTILEIVGAGAADARGPGPDQPEPDQAAPAALPTCPGDARCPKS